MGKCPVCQLPDGFHDHSHVEIPPRYLLVKGWLQALTKRQTSFTTWAELQEALGRIRRR